MLEKYEDHIHSALCPGCSGFPRTCFSWPENHSSLGVPLNSSKARPLGFFGGPWVMIASGCYCAVPRPSDLGTESVAGK